MQSQIQIRTRDIRSLWALPSSERRTTSALSPQKMTSTKDKQETVAVVWGGVDRIRF